MESKTRKEQPRNSIRWTRDRNKGKFTLPEWKNLLTSWWVPFCGPNVEAKKLSLKNHLAVRSNSISSVQMSMVTLCIVRTRFLSVSLVCINAMFMYSIYILNVLGPDMINLNQTDHPMMSVIFSTYSSKINYSWCFGCNEFENTYFC